MGFALAIGAAGFVAGAALAGFIIKTAIEQTIAEIIGSALW